LQLLYLPIALFILAAPAVLAGEDRAEPGGDDVFASDAYGFRIVRPGRDWSFQDAGDANTGTYTLILHPGNRKGEVQVTLRVNRLPGNVRDAKALRDKTLASTEGKPAYTGRSKTELDVAGRRAPGLAVEMKARGRKFRVHQFYLVEHGFAYTLGYHAPAGEFDSRLPVFRTILESFRFSELPPKKKREGALLALASRCGTEVPWETEWKASSRKAREGRRLILVLVRESGGFQTANSFLTVAFMDPDVLDIARFRFVLLAFHKGMGAPFESHQVYGLGPSTFGTSMLAVTPKGEVVGDTFSSEPSSFCDFLVKLLEAHRDRCGVEPPEGLAGPALAKWWLRRGEYTRASDLLKSPASASEHRLRADLLRRARRGEEALRELDRARSMDDGSLEAELEMDRAVVLIRMGETGRAYSVLTRFLNSHPGHPRKAEALARLGVCAFHRAGATAAGTVWRDLVETHPENRWAWKAASTLAGPAFALGVGRRASWPPEEVLDCLVMREREGLPRAEIARAEGDALEYLLENQRPDGSWICPTEVASATGRVPHDFPVAITAVSALSLLPYREDPRVNRAVHLAVGYLLQAHQIEKAVGRKSYFMDYGVWSKSYVLGFLCEAVERGVLDKEPLEGVLSELVSDLAAIQKSGGGWSYYVTRELGKAGQPSEQSISFCTASALMALHEAKQIGVPVPESMVEKALGCLERMKNPDGTFEYMLHHGNEGAPRKPNLEGAAGRGPACSLALFRWGRADLDVVRKTLRIFADHRDRYTREKRKTLMHTGRGGQGSHYLLFDYAYASVALSLLSKEERMAFRGLLLDTVLDARCKDGSFVDNPMVGPHFGTAMALIALRHLKE